MDHQSSSSEISYVPEHSNSTKRIWRVFWILLIVTVSEVGIGLTMYLTDFPYVVNSFLKGVIIILGLLKAFYIIAEFMHLRTELKNLILTLGFPLILLLWGIIAFLIDGDSFLTYRTRYDIYYKTEVVEKYLRQQKHSPTPPDNH